jgi:ABC-2 type transport system ATP-binding protein
MLLKIRNIAVRIGNTLILKDVSLSIDRGEIYGLLGPNGAGKTTTIAAALGLVPHIAGVVALLDRDATKDLTAIRRDIGVLPDPNGFYDWMTGEAYLQFFAGLYGVSRTQQDIADRMNQVGLKPRAGQPIGTWSHGMRQRLGLARALVADPILLVLDEPTNGLDPRGRRDIHDILLHLAQNEGVGILLCTHLLDDVERLCTKIGIIADGRTLVEGSIQDLLRTTQHLRRFRLRLSKPAPGEFGTMTGLRIVAQEGESVVIDMDPTLQPEEAWRQLLFQGWPIQEIAQEGGGLEELYLTLTERNAA